MATVTTTLVGTSTPQAVQVVVAGMTAGQGYAIRGQWGSTSWPVRAGSGVSDGSQLVRADLQAPVNVPVTYSVWLDDSLAATSAPITVPFVGSIAGPDKSRYLLSSLDGSVAVTFTWEDGPDQRDTAMRVSRFTIPGRSTPVVMYDVAAGEDGSLVAWTEQAQTPTMQSLVRAGAPLLLRTDGTLRDHAPVEFVQILSASSTVVGVESLRRWQLAFTVLDDPEPDTLVVTATWADFDRAYSTSAWTDFDAEWAGSTWDQFDVEDWSVR